MGGAGDQSSMISDDEILGEVHDHGRTRSITHKIIKAPSESRSSVPTRNTNSNYSNCPSPLEYFDASSSQCTEIRLKNHCLEAFSKSEDKGCGKCKAGYGREREGGRGANHHQFAC